MRSSELWAIVDLQGYILYSRGGSSSTPKLLVYTTEAKAIAASRNKWIRQVLDHDYIEVKKIYESPVTMKCGERICPVCKSRNLIHPAHSMCEVCALEELLDAEVKYHDRMYKRLMDRLGAIEDVVYRTCGTMTGQQVPESLDHIKIQTIKGILAGEED